MKVLLLGLNYAPEAVGTAVYTTGLAEGLMSAGHQVAVVAARPYYPAWRKLDRLPPLAHSRRVESGVDVTRVSLYIPRHPTGLQRLLHLSSFAFSAFGPALMRGLQMRPDLVLAIAPTLIAAPIALAVGRITGAWTWLHLQDLELDAANATGLSRQRGWIRNLAAVGERRLINAFNRVSTISPEMRDRLMAKRVSHAKISVARNWADPSVTSNPELSPLRAEWGIRTKYVALYSGALGRKQGAEAIIEAAKMLQERSDLTFVICSEGPEFERLQRSASGCANLRFLPLQPKARLTAVLSLADVHLLPQIGGVADLVMPSKLANMLASGRPIVTTAIAGTSLAKEVEGCGLVTPPGDNQAFAAAIERLIEDETLRRELGTAATARAGIHWRAESILNAFIHDLEILGAKRPAGDVHQASQGTVG